MKKRRLLILDFGGIGDASIIVPALQSLERLYSDLAYFHTQNPISESEELSRLTLLKNCVGRVRQEWSFYHPQHWNEILQFIRRNEITDLINLQPDLEYPGYFYNFEAWLKEQSSISLFSFDYKRIEGTRVGTRVGDDVVDVLRKAGFDLPTTNWQWLSSLHKALPKYDQSRRIALFLGAQMEPKRLSLDAWRGIVEYLLETSDTTIELYSGTSPKERRLGKELQSKFLGQSHRVSLVEDLSLWGLISHIGKADLLISNDSGAAHLAAAIPLPTIVLYWASDPFRWIGHSNVCATLSDTGEIDVDEVKKAFTLMEPHLGNTVQLEEKVKFINGTQETRCRESNKYYSPVTFQRRADHMTAVLSDDKLLLCSSQSPETLSFQLEKSTPSYERRAVNTPESYISRHLITQKAYGLFVQHTGYRTLAEVRGYSWSIRGSEWVMRSKQDWRQTQEFQGSFAVHLNYFDAVAFCRWLQKEIDLSVSLPSVEELRKLHTDSSISQKEKTAVLGEWCKGKEEGELASQQRLRYITVSENPRKPVFGLHFGSGLMPFTETVLIRSSHHCDSIGFRIVIGR